MNHLPLNRGPAFGSVVRQRSDLGQLSPHQKQTPYGGSSRTNGGSIYELSKVLGLKRSVCAHPRLSSAWHEINDTPVKWAFLFPIPLLTS